MIIYLKNRKSCKVGGFIVSIRTQFLSKSVIYIIACIAVSRQLLGKYVPAATNTHATIEVLLEKVFSTAGAENIRGLNLAVVKLTTVQVTKLPL
jgi:hypothetical protein